MMKRRQRLWIAAAMVVATVMAVLLVFAIHKSRKASFVGKEVDEILSGMTLEEKVGQMMLISFRIWKEVPEAAVPTIENPEEEIPEINITELNDEIRACLHDYHFGGTLLFAQNCRDAEQVLRLVSDIQAENLKGGGLPMLVCADQEGGNVVRLDYGTTGPGNMALAATGDPENAAVMAGIYGEELGLLGINTDLAPVMDVNNNPANPIIGVRSFSDSPETVAEYGRAYIEGLHSAGTIATLKHFPGHGDTGTDSHTGLPCIDKSYEELRAFELVPFREAVSGADMIMTAHIQYPQVETQPHTSATSGEEIFLPATMSKTILTDILRGDMGFKGVVVADALDMAAIADNFTDEDILRLTIDAGVDLLMLPQVTDTVQFQRNKDMVDTAVRMVRDGRIDEERVDESVRRILTLKKKYGLLDRADFTVTDEQVAAAVSGVGSAEHRRTAREIGQKALTLLKNEGEAFPLKMDAGESALILFADSGASRVGAGKLAKQLLQEQGALPEGTQITVMANTADNGPECVEAAKQADHVILVSRAYGAECLDPGTEDGFSTAVFDEIIEALHEDAGQVIVVSSQLPYDAARFPDADAILLTYGSSLMREVPPESGPGSAYAPNLPAALCACFGEGEPGGRLPVSLPKLDVKYAFTDEILYRAGE